MSRTLHFAILFSAAILICTINCSSTPDYSLWESPTILTHNLPPSPEAPKMDRKDSGFFDGVHYDYDFFSGLRELEWPGYFDLIECSGVEWELFSGRNGAFFLEKIVLFNPSLVCLQNLEAAVKELRDGEYSLAQNLVIEYDWDYWDLYRYADKEYDRLFEALSASEHYMALTDIDCDYIHSRPEFLRWIKNNPNLNSLTLSQCGNLHGLFHNFLRRLDFAHQINFLDISGLQIEDPVFAAIFFSSLENFSGLKTLVANNMFFSPESWFVLLDQLIAHCSLLESLDLSNNIPFLDAHVRVISIAVMNKKFRHLKSLNLGFLPHISIQSLAYLFVALPTSSLAHIVLRNSMDPDQLVRDGHPAVFSHELQMSVLHYIQEAVGNCNRFSLRSLDLPGSLMTFVRHRKFGSIESLQDSVSLARLVKSIQGISPSLKVTVDGQRYMGPKKAREESLGLRNARQLGEKAKAQMLHEKQRREYLAYFSDDDDETEWIYSRSGNVKPLKKLQAPAMVRTKLRNNFRDAMSLIHRNSLIGNRK